MIKRLMQYIKPLWARLSVAIVCMAGVAAISTGVMWLLKFMVDHALTSKDLEALYIGIVALITVFTLKSVLWYCHTYLTAYIGQTVARKIRNQVYEHLYSLSLGFFNEKTSGGILSRLTNDVTSLQVTLASAPTIIIRDGLTIIGLVGFLFYINWKFALICFSIIPIAALVLTQLGIKSRRAGRESQSKMADLYNIIQEGLTAMPIVKTYQNEGKEIQDFGKENQNYFNVIMRLARVEARSSPTMEVLGGIILGVIIAIGGRDVINNQWTLGAFMSFIGAAMSLYNPIKKFAKVNVQMQLGLASAERVFSLLDQKPGVVDKPNAQSLPAFTNTIEFRNVSFSYPNSNPVLDSINLTINKGDVVALVGPSGAGKTTLAQLVLRFYDPKEGSVLIDGIPFQDLTTSSLREKMAVVTQETYLFNESVHANISYGNPGASHDDVIKAAKAAYAHDFISQLPQGYDTLIGERGTRLSGGEKQRVAIARALLKDPAILILDEATSALDSASELMVQKALETLFQGRTVLIIAHRLATIRKADRIVVIEDGQIKESGNHQELLNRRGSYHRLFEIQSMA